MNNGLLYLGGFLAVVLGALFAVPLFVDWNGYRGVFEEEASKVLGRDVRVGGGVNVRFLPTPYVRFEKVRLADVTGQTGEPFLRAESFTMRLAVSPMLRGAFEANDIELNKPVLSLVLDGEGSGNWTTFRLKNAALPFVPQNVALHAVRINDGAVLIHGPAGKPVSKIEAIRGELAADTLQGPFRFRGTALMSGEERDLKLATLAAEADGKVRFKASMQGVASKNSYTLDGVIEDAGGKPHVTGELIGKITLPRLAAEEPAPQVTTDTGTQKSDTVEAPPQFNLKSSFAADARGAIFDALELELDEATEPQIITGKASAAWGDEPRFETALHAKWLDLDVLAAPKGQTASFSRLKDLGQSFLGTLGGDSNAAAKIEIEQVRIGGDQAGALRVDAERIGDEIKLREIKGGLPGGGRFQFVGSISGKSGERSLEGEGAIRGVNIARVQSFAQKSGARVDLKSEGPFWVAGHVTASDTSFELTGAKAEIAGEPMSGDIAISTQGGRNVTIRLETQRFDTAMLFPVETQRVATTLKRALGLDGGEDVPAAGDTPDKSGFSVRVAAAALHHEGKVYRDVDARLSLDGSDLRIPSARFITPAGVNVSLSGNVNTAGPAPKGTLSYDIDAPKPEALQEAAGLSGLTEILPDTRIAAISSARLSGLVRLGTRLEKSADISFDGLVDDARLSGEAAFDSGLKSWRSAPSRITASSTTENVAALLKALGVPQISLKGIAARPAEATFAVAGIFADGAQSYGAIKAEGLEVTLTGKLKDDREAGHSFIGQATVAARDAREAVAIAGIPAPAGVAGAKLEGNVRISAEKGAVTLASDRLLVGASTISGETKLAADGGDALNVMANLEADRVVVTSLLGWLAGSPPNPVEAPAAPTTYSVWPESAFDLEALNKLTGEVRLKSGVLELAEGLGVRESSAKFDLAPGKIRIAELKGRAGGGKFTTTADIEKVPGGASLNAKVTLTSDLSKLSIGAAGQSTLEFSGSARGTSPATLIGALNGGGTITLGDVRQPGPSADAVASVTEQVLTGKLENDADEIAGALTLALETSGVAFGSRSVPFTVSNGDVKLETMTIEGPQGTTRVATIVSLGSLAIDSVWQIAASAKAPSPPPEAMPDWKPAPKGPLPPVSFVYTGSLGDVAQLQVKVDARDLQRELSVRQMERKLDELDTIRKRDEERQRQEVERRKAMEAERAAAAAAAAAARAQQQRAQQQPGQTPMPPVVPEAAATVPPPAPVDASQGAGVSSPDSPQQPDNSAPDAAAGTQAPRQVTIEPVDPQSGDPDATASPVATSPPRVTVAPRPRPQRRHTTSDEINKAFGGWPN